MTERILHYLSLLVDQLVGSLGHFGIFIGMLIESCNIPLPSEIVMPLGGYLASTGKLTFWGVVFAGTAGNLVGSIISYFIGRYGGRSFLKKYGKYIFFSEKHLDTADHWFSKRGELTVFIGRLLPIVRTFISLPAGISKMRVDKFLFYTLLGCLPWTWLFTWLGYKLGQNLGTLKPYLHSLDYAVAAVVLVGIIVFWRKGLKKAKI